MKNGKNNGAYKLLDPVERFLKRTMRTRFDCVFLAANLTLCECLRRQKAEPAGRRAGGRDVHYIVQHSHNVYCRSGDCRQGKQVKKLARKDCTDVNPERRAAP